MMAFSLRRLLGSIKSRLFAAKDYILYRLPLPGSGRHIANFWDREAHMIHRRWGKSRHDFDLIGGLIRSHRPQSILDVGCGSGRLFPLYDQLNVPEVVGVDISEEALALAKEQFPDIPTVQTSLEDMDFPADRFDLAICNRVLQHVPPRAIDRVVRKLCQIARLVYVNELTRADGQQESFYMVQHDYRRLFGRHQFELIEEGLLDNQKYRIFQQQGGEASHA